MKYYTKRMFDSLVHILEFSPQQYESVIEFGVANKFEKLSEIKNQEKLNQGYVEMAKINLGFFGSTEHHGFSISNRKVVGSAEGKGVECYLTKDGRFIIENILDKELEQLLPSICWGATLSYSLLQNGKKTYLNSSNYSHFSQRNPRTLIGQKVDLTMVLCVVEGRNNSSKGVNGEQSADILLGLGCVNGLNADGGGSSEMIINNTIVNETSDGTERKIGSALVVYKKEVSKLKVAYCSGHGFNTIGKRSPDDEREWTFNDKVARAFAEEISKYEGVELKRFDDPTGKTDIPLKTRTDNANAWGADIYISFHHNANTGKWGNWSGIETFIYTTPSANSEKLAKLVHPEMVKAYGLTDRGIKKGNLHIVREVKCPVILVEGGFMDSTIDIKKLRDDNVLKNAGIGVANAVANYGELNKKIVLVSKPVKVEQPPVTKDEKGDEYMKVSSPALRAIVEAEIRDLTDEKKYGKEAFNKIWLDKFLKNELTVSDAIALLYAAKRKGI